MCFLIEIEPHQGLEARDPEDSTVSEAIETAYRAGPAVRVHMATGAWASLPVSGGVSDIYDDIVRMLKGLELGVYPFEASFLCSSFTAVWRFTESNGVLTIRTLWTAVDGTSDGHKTRAARFNNTVAQVVVEKQKFVAEWRSLLAQIKRGLLSVGYGNYLDNFDYLERLD